MKDEPENKKNKEIDNMAPDKEQRDRMWDHIESKIDAQSDSKSVSESVSNGTQTEQKHVRHRMITLRQLTAIAAIFVLAVTGITMHYGRTIGGTDVPMASGYVYAAENRVTGMTPQEILVFTGGPASNNNENEVYAPQIYYLDNSRLVFGNGYGLIIYDRTEDKVEGLIDLQAICSAYYNCDTVKTHITVKDNKIVVYNTKGDYTDYGMPDEESGRDTTETAWGFYHIYDLSDLPGKAEFIKCSESGEFNTSLK